MEIKPIFATAVNYKCDGVSQLNSRKDFSSFAFRYVGV